MKDLGFLKQNLIAHRGFHNILLGIPENSIPAFTQAVKYKFLIELDVHLLKDNTVVVFHDDNLKRMTGIDKPIKDCTFSELQSLSLQNTSEKIPSLEEVLECVNSQVPIIIEFKSDVKMSLLAKEAMKILKNYNGPFAIKSFHPGCVYYFKRHYPNIVRGQLSYNYNDSKIGFLGKFILKNMLFNFLTKPDFISYSIEDFSKDKINKMRKKKLVLGWTVRNKEQFHKNYGYFDNLICESMQDYMNLK